MFAWEKLTIFPCDRGNKFKEAIFELYILLKNCIKKCQSCARQNMTIYKIAINDAKYATLQKKGKNTILRKFRFFAFSSPSALLGSSRPFDENGGWGGLTIFLANPPPPHSQGWWVSAAHDLASWNEPVLAPFMNTKQLSSKKMKIVWTKTKGRTVWSWSKGLLQKWNPICLGVRGGSK